MISFDEIIRVLVSKEDIEKYIERVPVDLVVNRISTDTRTIEKGDFYLPLKGENFDGEKFIPQAIEKGAIGYCTTKEYFSADAFGIKVEDTKIAYLRLARQRRRKINPKVILITGSSGKTTTKELVYSVVAQKYKAFRTPLNHNNEIGFCQTIFEMPNDTEVLVLEAGMRGLGEIELISKYAEPDITIISNVGTAHIGRLGSQENIAKAKCEVVRYQKPGGVFIGHDSDLIKEFLDFGGKKIFFSIADTLVIDREIGYSKYMYKNSEYILNIEGDYNVENSLSAIEVGKELKIDNYLIKKGLIEYHPIEKRWEIENIAGYNIINDSYNANPDSMKATLKTMFDLYPKATIVLGDMGELGEKEKEYHKVIGEFIKKKAHKTNHIITVGDLAKEISNEHNFSSNEEAASYIVKNINRDATIFLKASRSMKFEEIIKYIKENAK